MSLDKLINFKALYFILKDRRNLTKIHKEIYAIDKLSNRFTNMIKIQNLSSSKSVLKEIISILQSSQKLLNQIKNILEEY